MADFIRPSPNDLISDGADAISTNADAAADTLGLHAGRLTTLEATTGTQGDDLQALEGRTTTAETSISNLETATGDLAGAISDLNLRTTDVETAINHVGEPHIAPLPIRNFSIPVTVYRTGSAYSATVDHEAIHVRGPGPTIYVDPVNGNNANDGLTWATAKQTPGTAAFDQGNYGPAELVIRGGIYTRAESPSIGRPDLIIRADEGTRPIFTQCDRSTAWTLHAGSAHKVALGGTGVVLDLAAPRSVLDVPVPLARVATIQEVIDTPGTAHHDGTTQYVHLHDGRAPDADVLVSRSTYFLNLAGTTFQQSRHVLIDGVEFWGGRYGRLRPTTAGSTFVAKNCAFRYAQDNGISVAGMSKSVLIDCEATHNGIDGFNYHADGSLTGDVLEVNCTGRLNGQFPGSSQNGSTTHEDMRIVRVGGLYEWNPGPNVADVGTTQSANFGVRASNALLAGEGDFASGGEMWLIDCTSASDVAVRVSGPVYTMGFNYSGTVLNGTLGPYQ